MYLKILFRNKKQLSLTILLLLLSTAFFCLSINLYANSVNNLKTADNAYSTICIMELHGNVDQKGNLLESSDGNLRQVAVKGYDFSPILEADGVLAHDLRSKYGIVIEDTIAMGADGTNPLTDYDIIRFQLKQEEPVTIPVSWDDVYYNWQNQQELYLEVLESAAGCFDYNNGMPFSARDILMDGQWESYADDIQKLNRSERYDGITLYPGVEYIAAIQLGYNWEKDRPLDKIYHNTYKIDFMLANRLDYFADEFSVSYNEDGTETITTTWRGGMDNGMPCPVMRVEDVETDPAIREAYMGLWDAAKYNVSTFFATLTNDISGVPLYHLGGAYLRSGRMITHEEYENGVKVCMVPGKLANMQGWRVGDTINIHFFRFDAFPNMTSDFLNQQPVYSKGTEGFFDSGEYEIVGIFDSKNQGANSGISETTMLQPWNTVYLPTNSVVNRLSESELPVHGALFTIWLENGSTNDFLASLEAKGLLMEDLTRFNPKFTFYDQGYSTIQPSLQNMLGTARLLLVLSTSLLVAISVLLAWFFVRSQKHNMGILRLLGGKKSRSFCALLLCSLLIAFICGSLGTAAGHHLTETVGQEILSESQEKSAETASFQAYIMAEESDVSVYLSVTADKRLSVQAACGVVLFPALTSVFALGYLRREPRSLLPQNKG